MAQQVSQSELVCLHPQNSIQIGTQQVHQVYKIKTTIQCSRAVIATHFQTACCGCWIEFKTSLVSWQEIQLSPSKRVLFLRGSNDLKITIKHLFLLPLVFSLNTLTCCRHPSCSPERLLIRKEKMRSVFLFLYTHSTDLMARSKIENHVNGTPKCKFCDGFSHALWNQLLPWSL